MPKSGRVTAEGVLFREQLEKQGSSDLNTPPALLDAGVVENGSKGLTSLPAMT